MRRVAVVFSLVNISPVPFSPTPLIALEVGDVERFPGPGHLASYARMVPRVQASGGKVRYGRTRQDVNRYLKWAYTEAANVVARFYKTHSERHVSQLYARIMRRKGHQKAVGAVGRHLAKATYWILKRREPYRDPRQRKRDSGA